jgi:hypothetical protein
MQLIASGMIELISFRSRLECWNNGYWKMQCWVYGKYCASDKIKNE